MHVCKCVYARMRGIKKLVYKGTAVEVRCSASVARNFGLSGTSARKLCAERAKVTCNWQISDGYFVAVAFAAISRDGLWNIRRVTSIMTNCQKQGDALDKSLSSHRLFESHVLFPRFLQTRLNVVRWEILWDKLLWPRLERIADSTNRSIFFERQCHTTLFIIDYIWSLIFFFFDIVHSH